MQLNWVERAMMNNPVRAAVQRHYEASRLLRMGGGTPGGRVLEVGCGRGVGTEIILDRFGAAHVDAFDLDPEMVRQARRRLEGRTDRVRLWTGSATEIEAPDDTYDAVFEFGIIHHIPDWRRAVAEVARVLRPGGRFYAEEVLARFILHPVWRTLLEHPLEDRFDAPGFAVALEAAGLRVESWGELWGHFAFYVARKPGGSA